MSRVFSGLRWAPSTLCVWLWGAQHGQLTVFSLHPKALNHSPDCCMSLAPGPDGKHRAWFAHLEAQSPIASLEPHCGVRLWLQCSPNPPSPPPGYSNVKDFDAAFGSSKHFHVQQRRLTAAGIPRALRLGGTRGQTLLQRKAKGKEGF